MALPARGLVASRTAPAREAIHTGPFVIAPTSPIETPDRTRISRAALPRGARFLLRAAILVVAVGGPIVAFAGEKNVTLDVEGNTRRVRTYAVSASDLLTRRGPDVGSNDIVTPNGKLASSQRVTYRRAKQVRLVLDGQPKTVTAHGLTVGEALKDLGLVPGPKDHAYPSSGTELKHGLSIFVRNAVHAKLRVDGRLRDVVSSADTVENLLVQAGVPAGEDDYVYPSRSTEPTDGMWIRVVRVRRIVESKSVRLPFGYVKRNDPSMESGVRRVVQQGSEGLKSQRWSILLEDGVRVSSRLLEENTIREPRDYIVRIGTKSPTFKGGGGSQSGVASWFEADGLVAAHRSLPIGSVVKVTNVSNGKSVTVRINQRGPFVEGRVIDLSDDAFERLAPLGSGTIKVKVQS
jgi:resuscitation-promoting factor RpfB